MTAALVYVRADLRAVVRDPLLRLVLVGPPALTALARFGVPPLQRVLAVRAGVDLTPHLPTVAAFLFTMVVPMLFGMIAGLLLTEDRDAGVLQALLVSPVSLRGYLAARAGLAALRRRLRCGGA